VFIFTLFNDNWVYFGLHTLKMTFKLVFMKWVNLAMAFEYLNEIKLSSPRCFYIKIQTLLKWQ